MFRLPSRIYSLKTIATVLLVIIPICMGFLLKPRVEGDALEYLLTQESLINHGSTEFRERDGDSFNQLIQRMSAQSSSTDGWFRETITNRINAQKRVAGGYAQCADGAYRSYHFFAYMLLSLPFRMLWDLFGADPAYSFGFLHALLLVCTVWMILRSRYFCFAERFWIAAGLILTCAVFYFNWIHPELFSTTFLVMAIVQYLDKRTATALVLASIASIQNQPIALVLPLFYLARGIENPDRRRFISSLVFPFTNWKQWLLTALAALIVLLPSFYYLRVYGHANPIAHLGGLSARWISFQRLFSLWFDMNQGIVVGFPGFLAGIVILLPTAFFYRKTDNRKPLSSAIFLLVLSFVLSIPCTIQGNWNAGSACMVRYGLWIGIPLLFVFAILLRRVGNPLKSIVLTGVVLLQLWVPTHCGLPAKIHYLDFNPLSNWVLNRFPDFYNPDPEIFAERLTGRENVFREQNVFVWKKNGKVKKILSRNSPTEASVFWGNNEFYRQISSTDKIEMRDGWSYLNGDFLIQKSGEFQISYDDDSAIWENWSYIESEFRWSMGQESRIRFQFPKEKMTLSGLVRIHLGPQGNNQLIGIYLNGRKLFERTVFGYEVLTLQFQPDWIHAEAYNELVFKVPNATPPSTNQDTRVLGVRFHRMAFQTILDE